MSYRLHIRTDGDIDRGIRAYARDNGLTKSQAARELLRQALEHPAQPIDRGWREGFAHGHRVYQLEMTKRARESGEL